MELRKRISKLTLAGALLLSLAFPLAASAQSMMMASSPSPSGSSTSDEQAGEQIYNQLTSGQTTCAKLTDDDFDKLGDFYMARMMGSSAHTTMDQAMNQQIGETANTQMHVAMAKRLSGCDPNAAYPASAGNYPYLAGMTGMMSSGMMNGNGWGWGSGWNMMGGYGYSAWSWIPMVLFWIVIALGIVWLVSWSRRRNLSSNASPLDILKQRYAKGEIDKKEYDEKLKDLSAKK